MTTRCKFKIDKIEETFTKEHIPASEVAPAQQVTLPLFSLEMSPVAKTDKPEDENSTFWKWTPSGSFKLSTINAWAVKDLRAGDEVYIDITKAA